METNDISLSLQSVSRRLWWFFSVPIAFSLMLVLLYETDLLPTGVWEGDTESEFIVLSLMELLTICLIPLALRLFRFKHIRRQLSTAGSNLVALSRWGTVRLLLLTLPMVVNTWLYYLYMHTAFGYMAIILLLSLLFVTPSKSRCHEETLTTEEADENLKGKKA